MDHVPFQGWGFFSCFSAKLLICSYLYFIHPSFSNSSSSIGNIIAYITIMPQIRLRLYDANMCNIQIYIMYNIGNLSGFIWCILILLALRQFYIIDVHVEKYFLEDCYPDFIRNFLVRIYSFRNLNGNAFFSP